MNKQLFLLRGLPGSGKSTLAKSIDGLHFEADQFFIDNGEYRFDSAKLRDAHNWCRHSVMDVMKEGHPKVIVSNTFTQEWEMEPYFLLAEELGYQVFSIIVENRHGGKNLHGVPQESLDKMKNRFEIKLI
jgi:predicted kinase